MKNTAVGFSESSPLGDVNFSTPGDSAIAEPPQRADPGRREYRAHPARGPRDALARAFNRLGYGLACR